MKIFSQTERLIYRIPKCKVLQISWCVSEEKVPHSNKAGADWFSVCSPGSEVTLGTGLLSSGFCNLQPGQRQIIN